MGRKRKVPPGLQLKTWQDSFDESSEDDVLRHSSLPTVTHEALLRQDLSPNPSTAPSSSDSSSPKYQKVRSIASSISEDDDEVESRSSVASSNRELSEDDDEVEIHRGAESRRSNPHVPEGVDDFNWETDVVHNVPDIPEGENDFDVEEAAYPDDFLDVEVIEDLDVYDDLDVEEDLLTDDEIASLESWEGEDPDEEQDNEYFTLLQTLSEKWLLVELDHTVSKAASNAFWGLATSILPSLFDLKKSHKISRKIPQFVHIRRKLHKQFVPPIHHKTAFQQDGTPEIIEVEHGVDPRPVSYTHLTLPTILRV